MKRICHYLCPSRALHAFGRDSSGQALVETTIMMPFLLLLCGGVFEFGSLFYQKMLIETGVRDAARYMARCSIASCSETIAQNIAVHGNLDGTGDERVSGWATGDVTITYVDFVNDDGSGNKLYRGGSTIQVVRVTTTYTYTGTGLLGFLGFAGIDFTAQHEQRVVGW